MTCEPSTSHEMAAVTTTPPPPSSASSSPSRRKPVPLHNLSPERWDGTKPLPIVPSADSPRLRQPPVSPVRVNFHQENWAQPSNANIETTQSYEATPPKHNVYDRDLPKTPEAPTPPPHTPLVDQGSQKLGGSAPIQPTVRQVGGKPIPVLDSRPVGSGPANTLSPMSAHSGLDFGFSQPSVSGRTATTDPDDASTSGVGKEHDENRNSRETATTVSTTQQQASIESSATTSASSVSGVLEAAE